MLQPPWRQSLNSNLLCGLDWQGEGTIDPSGVVEIAGALAGNASLLELQLRGNWVGEEAGAALGGALANNRTLESLSLWKNKLGSKVRVRVGVRVRG